MFIYLVQCRIFAWATSSLQNVRKLAALQKRAIRLVCKTPHLPDIGRLVLNLEIMKVESVCLCRLCHLYRIEKKKKQIDNQPYSIIFPFPTYVSKNTGILALVELLMLDQMLQSFSLRLL